ncbi:MAG: pyrimidine dimer DNA glycosylase/endonuclease V [Gammaproteobacteria bacterium]|jgi:hypothetical protein|nr:pyrimidine dimer DNA glycosylase/endonuclease V [Gammaproteobacteria bacterium]
MRLWSINPSYLDSKGLVALWREGLLAQKVLLGKTKGYKNHPQLDRFKDSDSPVGAIATYLRAVAQEADSRNYSFDKSKIVTMSLQNKIKVNSGQLEFEYSHLLTKLKVRDPQSYQNLMMNKKIEAHHMFIKVHGDIENGKLSNFLIKVEYFIKENKQCNL